jgi:hypothetical protein
MVFIGRWLSADDLQAVLVDGTKADHLLYGELDDDDPDMPEPDLDINKYWHGIHYLLTGTAWELCEGAGEAVLGGEAIGEDAGYGPARLLLPEAVRRIAAALDTTDIETMRSRFDPRAMTAADIYPSSIWNASDFDFLAQRFLELCGFYRAAADKGQAVLVAIT